MLDRLESIEKRYEELSQLIAQPEISTDRARLQPLAQEQAGLEDIVAKYRQYKTTSEALQETQAMLDDGLEPEMVLLAKEELNDLKQHQDTILQELKLSLLPKDSSEAKDAIVEIRAGTGGDEAALFVRDLYNMYTPAKRKSGGLLMGVSR